MCLEVPGEMIDSLGGRNSERCVFFVSRPTTFSKGVP